MTDWQEISTAPRDVYQWHDVASLCDAAARERLILAWGEKQFASDLAETRILDWCAPGWADEFFIGYAREGAERLRPWWRRLWPW